MKKLALLIAAVAMAESPRPIIEVPQALTAEYFRQAYIIEHATARQAAAIRGMQEFCSKNVAELRKTRSQDEEILFVCAPRPEGEKK